MRRPLICILVALYGVYGSDCATSAAPAGGSVDDVVSRVVDASATGRTGRVKRALFGDLHIHTAYSFDAFLFGVRNEPDAAYRFARGEPIAHVNGERIQLRRPLDFAAVTDHAEYLGVFPKLLDPEHGLATHPIAAYMRDGSPEAVRRALFTVGYRQNSGTWVPGLQEVGVMNRAWRLKRDATERHNEPGVFTTLHGFEWTSTPGGANLHRNVIFASSKTPEVLFTANDSQNPEALWQWLDELARQGMDAIAIPHNANISAGRMFGVTRLDQSPMDASYVHARARFEPLVEVTQVKGSSETHPVLSPNDEWASFELFETLFGTQRSGAPAGSYVRDAYRSGFELAVRGLGNPYRFGLIGSSDGHNAAGSFTERTYFGKLGVADGTAIARGSVPADGDTRWASGAAGTSGNAGWGASGLAGVWAGANSRDEVFAALKRKETFATSGPRLAVHLSATGAVGEQVDMGATVAAQPGTRVTLHALARRDPHSAPIERVQLIRGSYHNHAYEEHIIHLACSRGDPDAGCDPAPAPATCGLPAPGLNEWQGTWQTPPVHPGELSYYYLRVLEVPTCRWSTWDAVRNGTPVNPNLPAHIQERAWSSPIWLETHGDIH